jgi:hypothetical protein
VLHRVPVAAGAHYHANLNGHAVSSKDRILLLRLRRFENADGRPKMR